MSNFFSISRKIQADDVEALVDIRQKQPLVMVYKEGPESLHCIYVKDVIRLYAHDGLNHTYAVKVIDSIPSGDTLLGLNIVEDVFYRVWCKARPIS